MFAFAGGYDWMAYALAAAAIVLTLVVRPAVASAGNRWLDLALAAYVLVVAAAIVPVSPSVRFALSPAARAVDLSLRIDGPAASDGARPISIDPAATTTSLVLSIALVLLFWCARTVFARGGVRSGARAVAGLGLILAGVGMAQHATAPHLMYWTWSTRLAMPFGPFMNHSDFATWLVMALPLTAGYLIARVHSRQSRTGVPLGLVDAFDNTAMWLTTAIGFMAAALVVGLSRSGLIAALAGLLSLWMLSSGRMHGRGRIWLLAGLLAVIAIAATYGNTNALSARLAETFSRGLGGRGAIWRETWPMVKDFWLTGIGPGAYQRGMIVYQQSPRDVYFNHAHNEYLQVLSEGGVLLAIPFVVIAVAGTWQIRQRLGDRSPIYWVRAGAVSGLIAVAVQSIWETGLRVPANGLLFGVLAAMALHEHEG